MASFRTTGIDELCDSYAKAGKVPENITKSMLKAMGEIAKKAQAEMADKLGVKDTGITKSSLKVKEARITASGGETDITFEGSRKRGNTVTRNAEIAFINEFGKKGQPARPFISDANKASEEEVNNAGAKVFYNWLDSIGL